MSSNWWPVHRGYSCSMWRNLLFYRNLKLLFLPLFSSLFFLSFLFLFSFPIFKNSAPNDENMSPGLAVVFVAGSLWHRELKTSSMSHIVYYWFLSTPSVYVTSSALSAIGACDIGNWDADGACDIGDETRIQAGLLPISWILYVTVQYDVRTDL